MRRNPPFFAASLQIGDFFNWKSLNPQRFPFTVTEFTGNQRIVSIALPELNLIAQQVLSV
ncbi:hypothetical protein [Scytonema sp. PCC 10023]|uniref:hypothetical protein n=1 Tax=Scytonema sp. PCC 10023 TaxID=1680591 RepID=UPI0039C6B707